MIEIRDMCKKYKTVESDFYAINHITLRVCAGDFLMIMGRSGCGKSTLLNMMGLIDRFDQGEYFFHGADIKKETANGLAKRRLQDIGYIYQSYNLIGELNCLDNVALIQGYAGIKKEKRIKNAKAQLERVGLPEKANAYPQQLSGGQQQRVAVARALSNQPSLILADEPTGNLDYQTGIQIMELLKELNKEGITIVMVTHDQELTAYASRVIHMQDGEFLD